MIETGAARARRSASSPTTACISRRSWSPPQFAGMRPLQRHQLVYARARRRDGRRDPRAVARHADARRSGRCARLAAEARARSVDKLQITGGRRLDGEVRISGAKNAALPILAAALLADAPVTIRQRAAPARRHDHDRAARPHGRRGRPSTRRMQRRGRCRRASANASRPTSSSRPCARRSWCSARCWRASARRDVSLPGGCAIGARPVDLHVAGLRGDGRRDHRSSTATSARAPDGCAARASCSTPSPSPAPRTCMMAATLADGRDRARERGARAGSRRPRRLPHRDGRADRGRRHRHDRHRGRRATARRELPTCMPDRIEAGTFLVAGAITGGRVRVAARAARTPRCGDRQAARGRRERRASAPDWIEVDMQRPAPARGRHPHRAVPGVPDRHAGAVRGARTRSPTASATITETIFENRFMHVLELRRLGAEHRASRATPRSSAACRGSPARR